MADEARDLSLQEGGKLGLGAAEGKGQCLIPRATAEPPQSADRSRRNRPPIRPWTGAGLAIEAAVTERRTRERIGPPARDARIESRTMAERFDASHAEGDRHPRRPA